MRIAHPEIFGDMRVWRHGQFLIETDLNVWNNVNGKARPYGENEKKHCFDGTAHMKMENQIYQIRKKIVGKYTNWFRMNGV